MLRALRHSLFEAAGYRRVVVAQKTLSYALGCICTRSNDPASYIQFLKVAAPPYGRNKMDQMRRAGPASNIAEFMSSPENVLIIADLLSEAHAFLDAGKGKYDPDGAFHSKTQTLGTPISNPSPAHQMVRNSLLTTAIYSQGLAFVFDKIVNRGHIQNLEYTAIVFEESHINRSMVLLNQHYKNEYPDISEDYPMTLSNLTAVALANSYRNRKRMRDIVAPVLGAHGIWTIEDVDGERANFWVGPLLLMFSDLVLGKFKPFDGENE